MASLTEEERAIDPYRLLGIEVTASETEVKKAYRKQSLKCHPDKNPTPEAAVEFHHISLALGILTNPGKRAFLDKRLEQTRAAEARRAEMDAKRKVKVDVSSSPPLVSLTRIGSAPTRGRCQTSSHGCAGGIKGESQGGRDS